MTSAMVTRTTACIARLTDRTLRLGEGDLEAATTMLEASCAAAEGNDPWQWAVSQGILGMLQHERGRFLDARRTLASAQRGLEASSNRWFQGVVTMWLGLLELDEGRSARAAERLDEAATLLEEVRDQWFSNACFGYRGVLAHLEGDLERACTILDEASVRAARASDVYRSATFLPFLGATFARLGATATARDAFEKAEAIGRTSQAPRRQERRLVCDRGLGARRSPPPPQPPTRPRAARPCAQSNSRSLSDRREACAPRRTGPKSDAVRVLDLDGELLSRVLGAARVEEARVLPHLSLKSFLFKCEGETACKGYSKGERDRTYFARLMPR